MAKKSLLMSAASISAFAGAYAADVQAQSAPAAAASPSAVEEVVVTGSLIPRPPGATSPTPLTTISGEDIQLRGISNVADVVNAYPQLGVGQNPGNTTFNDVGAGANYLSLRGLGDNRTLVLVDGRRHVGGGTDFAVDINTIPAALVDRIDIVTGGASAVYGADAVAGVVNFILKKNYQGLEMGAKYGDSTEGGGADLNISILAGTNFADNRGNITLFAEYDKANGINQSDRLLPDYNFIPSNSANGRPYKLISGNDFTNPYFAASGGRAASPYGFAGFPAPYNQPFIFDASGKTASPYNLGTYLGNGTNVGGDGLNFDETINYLVPVKRVLAGGMSSYEVTSKLKLNFDIKFSDVIVNYYDSPWYNYFSIKPDNPYLPPTLASSLAATGQTFGFYRWNEDFGRRDIKNDSKTYRASIGADYDFSDSWKLSSYYQFGEVDNTVLYHTYLTTGLDQAVDAIELNGQIVCRDPVARAEGCLPINVLKVNNASDPAIQRIHPYTTTNINLQEHVANVTLTGKLPRFFFADQIGVAAGVEYRSEFLNGEPDLLAQSNQTIFGGAVPLKGSFNVKEGFAQIDVPLLRDLPFAQAINLTGAVRVSDYSTVGTQVAYNGGADWTIIPDFRLRAMYARAVRAPNVKELFTASAPSFPTVTDPCDYRTIGSGSSTRAANCLALGIPVGFTAMANDGFSIHETVSGNPNLGPEKADTVTLGAVFEPRVLPHLVLSVDYYDIKINGVIKQYGVQTLLNSCVDGASVNQAFCSTITRGADHQITNINDSYINAASLKTSGVDIEAHYGMPLFDGTFRAGAVVNYLKDFTYRPSTASNDVLKMDGMENFPRWKGNFTAAYTRGPFTVSYVLRYLDSVRIGTSQESEATDAKQIPSTYPAVFYNDLQVRFAPAHSAVEYYVGVNDIADEGLPYGYQANGSAQGYNVIGRFIYGGVRVRLH